MFRGIVGNLTAMFAALTLGLVTLAAIIDEVVVSRHLVSIAATEMQAVSGGKQTGVESWQRELSRQAVELSQGTPVERAMEVLQDGTVSPAMHALARQSLQFWLEQKIFVSTFVGFTVLDGTSGLPIVANLLGSSDPLDPEGAPWAGRALYDEGRSRTVSEIMRVDSPSNEPVAAIATPVVDADQHLLGVLVVYADLRILRSLVSGRDDGVAGILSYILDGQRRFVTVAPSLTDADVLKRVDATPMAEACGGGRSGVYAGPDYRGRQVVAAYRWLPDQHLCLVSQIDRAAAVSTAGRMTRLLLLGSFCLLWLGGVMSMIFGQRVAAPILSIARAVRAVGQGERGVRLPDARRDELGDVAKGFNLMVEALERREAELERSRRELSTTLTHIDQALARFDRDMRLFFYNERFPSMFNLDGAWLRSRPHMHEIAARRHAVGLISTHEYERLHRHAIKVLKSQEAFADVMRLTDGRAIEIRHEPVPDGGVVVTYTDVTTLHRQQEELRAARDTAERANRAKSDFLAAMSHELRTPLNAILGFSQLLQLDKFGTLNPRQAEFVQLVIQSGEHLLELISDVLELSKIEAGRIDVSIEKVEIQPVMKTVRATLEPMAEQRKVRLLPGDDGAGLPALLADRTRLIQALINLGTNAIKYNIQNGTVGFEITYRDGEGVRITVADTGIGIPVERQGELFRPFNRLGAEHGPVEGTGIGLNLTRQFVDLMGGKLGFSSTPGFGSRFWIDLPAVAAGLAPVRPEDLRPNAPGGLVLPLAFEVTVLYVEDNPVSRELMRNVMEFMSDARLLEAENGEQALLLAAQHKPDLIVLDIDLPDLDGYAVLRRLREVEETMDIPVVALTKENGIKTAEELAGMGFRAYLTKPLQIPRLLEVVKAIARDKAQAAG
jgi:signal transduction histidine kinase/CheY-like chemotaxis protein/PAS domain-containing protein